MIKRKIFAGCLIAVILAACACEKKEETGNKEQNSGAGHEEISMQTEGTKELTEDTIRQLVDANIYCNLNVFGTSFLPRKSESMDYNGRKLYQVDEAVFADYASFEEYIRSIYCKETADLYLYKVPYEETPRYVNVDGKLYVDTDGEGGKGYYVDWSEYTIQIRTQTENRCEFTVTAVVEWPAEVPQWEDYAVNCAALLEDGKWVLETMFY